ncbi:RNA-binding S4 domain-containing protein [Afifella pfennigii]|uniref:RNA-binding S4 domain-containing protein n=1 Tax=Afifella pfennigii TaxID=209897 RepID=UPI0004798806|nr:RNA-binding S4 domain-containing protein [Afifella pfennigii]
MSPPADAPTGTQRLDRWLWHARFARTRSQAQKLVCGGHVRLNRDKVTQPSRQVRVGDVLTLALPRQVKVVELLAMAEKRGSYALAQTLYRDVTPKESRDAPQAVSPAAGPQARPDARQRRKLIALKRQAWQDE